MARAPHSWEESDLAGLELRVKLPDNRLKTGTLELVDSTTGLRVFGPIPALGRGARNVAKDHGNPNGKATLPYGDTPTGNYQVPRVLKSGSGTSHPADVYGSVGVIVLDPIGGEAAAAKANGRTGLLIHAGRQVATPTPLPSHLRATNGCIRVLEPDLAALIQAMKDNAILFPGDVVVSVGPEGPPGGGGDDSVEGDPPNLNGSPILP